MVSDMNASSFLGYVDPDVPSTSLRASSRLGRGSNAPQFCRASLGWAGGTSFDFAQDRLCPYVAIATLRISENALSPSAQPRFSFRYRTRWHRGLGRA